MKPGGGLLNWLYPSKCLCCRRILEEPGDFCSACRRDLPLCGTERKGDFFERCVSAVVYTGDIRRTILRYKFYHRTAYAGGLGRLTANRIRKDLTGSFDLITWVPISSLRKLRRGYDQTRLMGETVSRELGLPLLRTLKKIRHNKPQSGMSSASARRANVMNVYAPYHPEQYRGKRVLLLDDVVTTGSTLSEAARILRTAGAKSVVCATIASAEKGKP